MKRLLLVLVACEKADPTYAIGWEGPRLGEQIEVISSMNGNHEHTLYTVGAIDGDRITSDRVHFIDASHADYEMVDRGHGMELATPVSAAEAEDDRVRERLTFADPAPRKRVCLHRFRIGEAYRLPPVEADAMGFASNDATLVLRAAHGDTLMFDIDATLTAGRRKLHGTLETVGPNYRWFHLVADIGGEKLDHLQKRP